MEQTKEDRYVTWVKAGAVFIAGGCAGAVQHVASHYLDSAKDAMSTAESPQSMMLLLKGFIIHLKLVPKSPFLSTMLVISNRGMASRIKYCTSSSNTANHV